MRVGLLAVVALASCYAPELRDCSVTCASAADCASDQICGSDRYCAAPERAGTCAGMPGTVDAAPVEPPVDAPPDAPPPPPTTTLRLEFSGKGRVIAAGIGSCSNSPCDYTVVIGIPLAVTALPDDDFRFDRWEPGPCTQQDATCNTTAMAPMTRIKARFKSD